MGHSGPLATGWDPWEASLHSKGDGEGSEALFRAYQCGEDWGLGAVQDSPREVLRDICSRPDAQSHRKTPPQRHQDWTTQHKHLVLENLPSWRSNLTRPSITKTGAWSQEKQGTFTPRMSRRQRLTRELLSASTCITRRSELWGFFLIPTRRKKSD